MVWFSLPIADDLYCRLRYSVFFVYIIITWWYWLLSVFRWGNYLHLKKENMYEHWKSYTRNTFDISKMPHYSFTQQPVCFVCLLLWAGVRPLPTGSPHHWNTPNPYTRVGGGKHVFTVQLRPIRRYISALMHSLELRCVKSFNLSHQTRRYNTAWVKIFFYETEL